MLPQLRSVKKANSYQQISGPTIHETEEYTMRMFRFMPALLFLLTATVYGSPPTLPEGKNLSLGGQFSATDDSFTFGIIADRAGGNPLEGWPYFERAVREMNVLHPDFVLMPGDLIDGYIRREGPEGAAKDFTEQYR